MPRRADHDARRAAIVEALWRVIRRSGLHGVSVRSVAAEAGMSPTALRYYFPSQLALLEQAMTDNVDSGRRRVVPLLVAATDRAGVERMLQELLPTDGRRRFDQEVYLAFATWALADPELAKISEATGEGVLRLIARAVEVLAASGELLPELDRTAVANCLDALVQGLTFQGCARPGTTSPEQMRATLSAYLDLVCVPRADARGLGGVR
ncbi:TetR/AcrR family transcriptional regulator [Pseudonocardia xishanensis]|uniref:TetR/AcrR family transcriptional regulator n=1 Tax=Pseudonocardia xishanensis TaxID=630995 RepID=UPI0031E5F42F